jgi:hypothetical protein
MLNLEYQGKDPKTLLYDKKVQDWLFFQYGIDF